MARRTICSVTGLILVALCACGKQEHPSEPTLAVDREALQFGGEFGEAVYVGTSKQESLLIENQGLQALVLSDVVLTGPSVFTLQMPEGRTQNVEVDALGHTFVTVYFEPQEAQSYAGTLTVYSNAANEPEKVIQLTGTGVTPP